MSFIARRRCENAKRKTPSHQLHTHTYALRQIKSEIKVLILLRHKQPRIFSRHLCDKVDFRILFKASTSKAIFYNVLAVCMESLRLCDLCWCTYVCVLYVTVKLARDKLILFFFRRQSLQLKSLQGNLNMADCHRTSEKSQNRTHCNELI